MDNKKTHNIKKYGKTVVIELEHLDSEQISDYLKNIRDCLPPDFFSFKRFGIDFKNIEYVNSNMIGAYIALYKDIKRLRKKMYFLNTTEEIKKIFTLIHLNEHIEIFDEEESKRFYEIMKKSCGDF